MRRGQWLVLASVTLALVAGAIWVAWPAMETPLSMLFRRDTTWETMQSRGSWRVGLDPSFPPFEALDDEGVPVGYDVDLAEALAGEWGMEVEIVATGFDSLLDALKAAKIDSIVSAYPYDPRLTRDVAFSRPYFEAGLRLAGREGDALVTVAGLAGKQVAVEWGSQGDMVGRRWQREGLEVTLVPFATPQEAVEALVTRPEIAALLVDNVTLRQAQGAGAPIVAIGEPLESSPYVIVAPLRATELHAQIETALEALEAGGGLAELERRWFAAQP